MTNQHREQAWPFTREEAEAKARLSRTSTLLKDGLAALDERTARGISPCAVLGPDGTYRYASSAEDAFYIRLGRHDLAV